MSLWIWKNKLLFNLTIHQPDIDKFYLYAKDPYEAKYQLLIDKCEDARLKHFNDSKALTEYSNVMWMVKAVHGKEHQYCISWYDCWYA